MSTPEFLVNGYQRYWPEDLQVINQGRDNFHKSFLRRFEPPQGGKQISDLTAEDVSNYYLLAREEGRDLRAVLPETTAFYNLRATYFQANKALVEALSQEGPIRQTFERCAATEKMGILDIALLSWVDWRIQRIREMHEDINLITYAQEHHLIGDAYDSGLEWFNQFKERHSDKLQLARKYDSIILDRTRSGIAGGWANAIDMIPDTDVDVTQEAISAMERALAWDIVYSFCLTHSGSDTSQFQIYHNLGRCDAGGIEVKRGLPKWPGVLNWAIRRFDQEERVLVGGAILAKVERDATIQLQEANRVHQDYYDAPFRAGIIGFLQELGFNPWQRQVIYAEIPSFTDLPNTRRKVIGIEQNDLKIIQDEFALAAQEPIPLELARQILNEPEGDFDLAIICLGLHFPPGHPQHEEAVELAGQLRHLATAADPTALGQALDALYDNNRINIASHHSEKAATETEANIAVQRSGAEIKFSDF